MTEQTPMTEQIQTAGPSDAPAAKGLTAGPGKGGPVFSRSLLAGLLRLAADERLPIRFQARGGSMRPFIRDGDTITVSPLPRPGPRFGEVVAFLHPISGQVIVHRVIRREAGRFWTQGDSVGDGEGPMEASHLLGGVSRLERAGRPRRLGLGPERVLIAGVTRTPWLFLPLRAVRRLFLDVFGRHSAREPVGKDSAGNLDQL
jgi:hypothetical protein